VKATACLSVNLLETEVFEHNMSDETILNASHLLCETHGLPIMLADEIREDSLMQ
jgi:hypothetical protein